MVEFDEKIGMQNLFVVLWDCTFRKGLMLVLFILLLLFKGLVTAAIFDIVFVFFFFLLKTFFFLLFLLVFFCLLCVLFLLVCYFFRAGTTLISKIFLQAFIMSEGLVVYDNLFGLLLFQLFSIVCSSSNRYMVVRKCVVFE